MTRRPPYGRWVTRHTAGGIPFRAWEQTVPRIPDDHLRSIVYLYRSVEDAMRGERQGGTGFSVVVRFKPPYDHLGHVYFVTNRHVVTGAPVVRLNKREGGVDAIPLTHHDWIPHPSGDDVTIWRVEIDDLDARFDVHHIPTDFLATQERLARFRLGVGDDCLMLGRFVGVDESDENRPTARFGNLMRTDPVPVPNQVMQRAQESFFVEMRSLSGFSGSPVFCWHSAGLMESRIVDDETGQKLMEIGPVVSSPYLLLGIDWGHIPRHGPIVEEDKRTLVHPPLWAQENTGMAAVVPAWKLVELLNEESVMAEREETEAEYAAKHAPPVAAVPDVAPPGRSHRRRVLANDKRVT